MLFPAFLGHAFECSRNVFSVQEHNEISVQKVSKRYVRIVNVLL